MGARFKKRISGRPPGSTALDKNEIFVLQKCTTYLRRHLNRYPDFSQDSIDLVCWILGNEMQKIDEFLLSCLSGDQQEKIYKDFQDAADDPDEYSNVITRLLMRANGRVRKKYEKLILRLLDQKVRKLRYRGESDIEKSINSLKKMFKLTDQGKEFCTFLFIIKTYGEPESFFKDYLNCDEYRGQKYLLNILGISHKELNGILNNLNKIGIIETRSRDFDFEWDFFCLIQNQSLENFSGRFYARIPRNTVALENHFIDKNKIDHILKLLSEKRETSTHLLFYGPPGTGKSSFAYGIADKLGIPAYEIAKNEENKSASRRAALIACLNMTNAGQGSLILVDEADNLLNTKDSWFVRGETQDKGWINQLLEEPGARVIWITNKINRIEQSVTRRFAFSIHFKPFNHRQRIQLWDSILSINKRKRFFSQADIEHFAKRYRVNAGAIDLSVKKAIETKPVSKNNFHRLVTMALDAYVTLIHSGEKPVNRDRIETTYTLDGLNIHGDIHPIINQLKKFDQYLRCSDQDNIKNMNLLFYGPPGTGKSEFARYLAESLGREIMCRRVSDLQSMWVGKSEKNIKSAFAEAETEDAILIIDEADSLLFSRDRAQRSWEISFTNEFLTQMERFRGILICTTNRLMDLDSASIRRFNHKVGFDYLKPDGNIIFYEKLLAALIGESLDKADEKALKNIKGLAPGDFKVVRDRYFFYPRRELRHQVLMDALQEEAKLKRIHQGDKPVGF